MDTVEAVLARAAQFSPTDDHTKFTSLEWNLRVLDLRMKDLIEAQPETGPRSVVLIEERLDRTDEAKVLRMLGLVCKILLSD